MDNLTIAKRIKECRESLGKTQKDVAQALSFSHTTISKYENEGTMDLETIQSFNQLFCTDLTADTLRPPRWSPNIHADAYAVALDTSVFLKRPRFIENLNANEKIDYIFVSSVVLKELNRKKDNKRDKNCRNANLAITTFNHVKERPGNKITDLKKESSYDPSLSNDRRIMIDTEKFAEEYNTPICIVSADKDFKMYPNRNKRISIRSIDEFEADFFSNELTREEKEIYKWIGEGALEKLKKSKTKVNPNARLNGQSMIFKTVDLPNKIDGRRVEKKKMVEELLRLGADINIVDDVKYKISPLCRAVQKYDYSLVSFLLAHGADIDLQGQGKNRRNTALSMACYHKDKKMVELLLRHNPILNGQDDNGYTPLIKACIYVKENKKQIEPTIIEMLLNAGADTRIRDNDNLTAYDHLRKHDKKLAHRLKERMV